MTVRDTVTSLNNILTQFSDPASKFRRELADAGIGIDLLSDETALPDGAVRSAENVDISRSGFCRGGA
jgi:ribosomal protein S11